MAPFSIAKENLLSNINMFICIFCHSHDSYNCSIHGFFVAILYFDAFGKWQRPLKLLTSVQANIAAHGRFFVREDVKSSEIRRLHKAQIESVAEQCGIERCVATLLGKYLLSFAVRAGLVPAWSH